MTVTVDFDSNPRTIFATAGSTVQVRFVDKSSSNAGVINSWAWTVGGVTSAVQNPIISLTAATGYISAAVTVGDSAGGSSTLTRATWLKIVTGTFTPPAANTAYRNISLFVYERSVEPAPKSTCICRTKTAACQLFFKDLQITGAITKAGKATFDIVDGGTSSAVERDLFESLTTARYKNIAIIAGYDVIWSGKITRSDKERMSQPSTTTQKAVYHCEAYSDIKKMSDWNILTPKSEVAKTPGQIVTDICAVNPTEPDFIGTKGGYIDTSGSQMQMTLADTDKLTAFAQVTNATDYDWRTRIETMLFTYLTFTGSNTVTMAGMTGVSPGDLVGQWLLFPTNNYLTPTSKPNYRGVIAWGLISANTATTITATVTGTAAVPLATDNCLVVGIPRLDFSSDVQEPTSIRTFTNSVNCQRFSDADDKVDLFTKVIAKGKSAFQTSAFAANSTISISIPATQLWDSTYNFFAKSSFVTRQTDGYVYSYGISATTIVLIGQEYSLKSGDLFFVYGLKADGTTAKYGSRTIIGTPTKQTQLDGTLTTTVSFAVYLDTIELMKYSVFISARTYIKDYTNLSTAFPSSGTSCNIGKETRNYQSGGIDSEYGPYVLINSTGQIGYNGTPVSPHYAGCFITQDGYPETSPATGSPVKVHGIITKTITTDTATTLPDLEVSATNALLQSSQYYQKSTMMVSYYQWTYNRVREGDQLTGPAAIREGSRVSIVPYTGATAVQRQVVIWEFDGNSMIYKLTLGDYQKDVWNVLDKNTAASQKGLI